MRTATFIIKGMNVQDIEEIIEIISDSDGINDVRFDKTRDELIVDYNGSILTEDDIKTLVSNAGYPVVKG